MSEGAVTADTSGVLPDVSEDAVVEAGLNPFEPGFFEHPYDQYRRLREGGRVQQMPFGGFLLTQWEDVHTLLRTPNTSVEDDNIANVDLTRRQLFDQMRPDRDRRGSMGILNIDPPDHTRLRKLVSKAFTPRTVEQLRPRVQALVDEMLDDLEAVDGPVDLVSGLAFPLPFAVISEMLGMPEADRDQLRAWSHTVVQSLDPILAITKMEEILAASDRITEHVTAAIEWKRSRPDDDDLLNALIRAEDDGDVLSDTELLDNVVLLYLAGHETTVNLIGNGTYALLRHPDQLQRLHDDPSLAANAVEELLRFDSPVQFSRRITLEPMTIAGQDLEPGTLVMTGLGCANHDPAKFGADAESLDRGRETAREHVSFGSGVHHCLGAALARLEGQVAIGTLARRFPDLALVDGDPPEWNGRVVLRGLERLPVTLG
jgi:cytochrome P450